jgi:hypothetical protein
MKQRERLATCELRWPVEVPDEATDREAALRRWRGQHEDDAAVKPPDALNVPKISAKRSI